MGRAMFTFGSVQVVADDTYKIPKLELDVRVQPHNAVVKIEPGKLPPESINWAEFHNGVAAGLRIAPSSRTVPSSWITFNKLSELSPDHLAYFHLPHSQARPHFHQCFARIVRRKRRVE